MKKIKNILKFIKTFVIAVIVIDFIVIPLWIFHNILYYTGLKKSWINRKLIKFINKFN